MSYTIVEYIEMDEKVFAPASLRILIYLDNNETFRVWEADDNIALFYDLWDMEDVDEDGNYWFDAEIEPVVTESPYFFGSSVFRTIWLFWNIECHEACVFHVTYSLYLRTHRRWRAWTSAFGNLRGFFNTWLHSVLVTHIISLQLVGVGFSCDLLDVNVLRLFVSNTNDLLVYAPHGINVGLRPGSSDYAEKVSFFFYGPDYQQIRLYSAFVRKTVRFNIYEYQGLLFSGETKIKKLTKQKQK